MSQLQVLQEQHKKETQYEEKTYQLFYNLLVCTFQTVFGYICLDVCVAISLHYISGELGSIANAGYGFSLTCMNILILPVGFGLNQSLNMHTSQALGDKKIELAKRFFNLNLYTMLFVLIPLGTILLATIKYPLSLTISSDNREDTANYALEFSFYLLPAMLLALEFENAKIFMVAHKITYPFIFIHFTTLGIHLLMTWLFVVQFEWKIFGAGFAIILTEVFNIIGLLLFIQFTNIKKDVFQGTNLMFNIQIYKTLGFQYIKTSIPIVLHIFSEFFVFFLLSFIALSLGTAEMNAHLGLSSICGIFFSIKFCITFLGIPISLSIALMCFVGTEMGKNNVKKAKIYVAIGLFFFAITTIICSILLWTLKEQIAMFYSSNDESDIYAGKTKQLFMDTIPWLIGGMIIVDGLQGTLSGALKGMNLVQLVFYSTIISYYVICIPLIVCFTYSWGLDQGLIGIWQGFGIANSLLAILYLWLLFTTDWEMKSKIILNRVNYQNELCKVEQLGNENEIQIESQERK